MTDHDLLVLRTRALERVVAQLHEVRGLHTPVRRAKHGREFYRCSCGHGVYPCPTARAAGAADESAREFDKAVQPCA